MNMKIPHLRSSSLPQPPQFPDPNLRWLCQVFKKWEQSTRADVGIIGIPFDRASISHRQGARLGPKFVRESLYSNTDYCIEHDLELSKLEMVDFGDIDVDVTSYSETQQRVEAVMGSIFSTNTIPLIIGGDHSNTYPCIKALSSAVKSGEKIGVIDFDSHHDVRSGWRENSGLWAREIQEIEGHPISGENIVQIGIHGYFYSRYYADFVRKNRMRFLTPLDVSKKGISDIVDQGRSTMKILTSRPL